LSRCRGWCGFVVENLVHDRAEDAHSRVPIRPAAVPADG
jgi:hypothetical protein